MGVNSNPSITSSSIHTQTVWRVWWPADSGGHGRSGDDPGRRVKVWWVCDLLEVIPHNICPSDWLTNGESIRKYRHHQHWEHKMEPMKTAPSPPSPSQSTKVQPSVDLFAVLVSLSKSSPGRARPAMGLHIVDFSCFCPILKTSLIHESDLGFQLGSQRRKIIGLLLIIGFSASLAEKKLNNCPDRKSLGQ